MTELFTVKNTKGLIFRWMAIGAFWMSIGATAQGQVTWNWERSTGAEVLMESNVMAHAFAGGLTAPQWSPIDMDNDGDDDAFCFDRDGNRILVFERTENPLVPWIERPDWEEGWPVVNHWVLLRDFNCDGYNDLFTGF